MLNKNSDFAETGHASLVRILSGLSASKSRRLAFCTRFLSSVSIFIHAFNNFDGAKKKKEILILVILEQEPILITIDQEEPLAKRALIVGAGKGISASFARALAEDGYELALAARDVGKLDSLVDQTGSRTFTCDASDRHSVKQLFRQLDDSFGAPNLVLYNPSMRVPGSFTDTREEKLS